MKSFLIGLFALTSVTSFASELCLKNIKNDKGQKYAFIAKKVSNNKNITIYFGASRDYVKAGMVEAFYSFMENGYQFTGKPQNYTVCLINPNISESNVNYIDGFYFMKNK